MSSSTAVGCRRSQARKSGNAVGAETRVPTNEGETLLSTEGRVKSPLVNIMATSKLHDRIVNDLRFSGYLLRIKSHAKRSKNVILKNGSALFDSQLGQEVFCDMIFIVTSRCYKGEFSTQERMIASMELYKTLAEIS